MGRRSTGGARGAPDLHHADELTVGGPRQYEQHDFSGGELDPDYVWRADLKARAKSLQVAENVTLKNSGAAAVRPGTRRIDDLPGDGRLEDLTVGATVFTVAFCAGVALVYDRASRTRISTVSGAPWTGDMVPALVLAPYGNQVYVFHQALPPQVLTRNADTGGWSLAAYSYDTNGAVIQQPYWRYAAKGVAVTPSAVAGGGITLTASAPYFVPGHVNTRVRLQGRELRITAYTSPTQVTADVAQLLYPTVSIQVDNASFDIGEVIKGTDSNAQGVVVSIAGGTVVVLMQTFTSFEYIPATSSTAVIQEKIVGAHNAATIQAAPATLSSQAPVLDVTEQVMSPLRGYPGTGVVHNNRLMMSRFPGVPFGIAASAINAFGDFEVGTDSDDAFFEVIGDQDSGTIQHLHSAEQLLVMTSRHLLYVPESESFPLTPSNFTLIRVGPDGGSTCRPVTISEGVVYAQTAGGSVIGAFPTGDVRRSWKTADLSYQAGHLVRQPYGMTYVSGSPTVNERYVYIVNADGGLSVLAYDESDLETAPSLVPWTTAGLFRSVAALDGECWVLVQRGASWRLEVFDLTALLDGQAAAGTADGSGAAATFLPYAGLQCALLIAGVYVADVHLDVTGGFTPPAGFVGAMELGWEFAPRCIPWPPLDPEDQNPRRRRRRISGAVVRYQGAAMMVNGQQRPLYDGGEDTAGPPPARDETRRFPCFGWSFEPTVEVSRGAPAAWLLLGLSLEVSA